MKIGYSLKRHADIVKTLIRGPRTARMLYQSSTNFEIPYPSLWKIQVDLAYLKEQGFLGRQELPTQGPGQNEYLYFLKKKARLIEPDVDDISSSSCVLRGLSSSAWHTLATSEFLSHMERSAGEVKDRVRLIASKQDGYFKASLEMKPFDETATTSLKPDYTQVLMIDGVPSLFFVEIQHKAAIINPVARHSVSRSFMYKLAKYKAFQRTYRNHEYIREIQAMYGCGFTGYRVLVVTTKGEDSRQSLLLCAKNNHHGNMFYFTTMEEITKHNMFIDSIWNVTTEEEKITLA